MKGMHNLIFIIAFGKNLHNGHYFIGGNGTLNLRCEMKNTENPEFKKRGCVLIVKA